MRVDSVPAVRAGGQSRQGPRRRKRAPIVVLLGMTIGAASLGSIGPAPAATASSPAVRAIPATGLLDREVVDIRGAGFGRYEPVGLLQCAGAVADGAKCGPAAFGTADAHGAFDIELNVRRQLVVGGSTWDCVAVACFAVLQDGSAARLQFVKGAPLVRAALPTQPACVPWPAKQWPTGAIPAGVDPTAVASAGNNIIAGGATAVVVIQGGRLVYEKYASGHNASTIEPSFSMSKSFTSTVIGLLVQQHKLQLDARAPIAEWAGASDPRRAITLRNILNMSSGLQWNEIYSNTPDSDVFHMILDEPNEAAYVIAKPLIHTPGTVWNYSTGDAEILGHIIGQTVGVSGSTYAAYLHKVLLDPLGTNPVNIGFDKSGGWMSGWFTNMSTRNFAKLGELYLRNGVWSGKQFLAPSWVEFVRTPSPADAGYGGQFWLEPDGSFEMIGLYGQTVRIVPQEDLIVAVNNGGNTQSMVDAFRHAVEPTCGVAQPGLVDDHATVAPSGSINVPVLANDAGGAIGLAPATLTVADLPAKGTARVVGTSIRYTARPGATGADHFSYVVCTSDRRACPTANVSVTIG